MSPAVRSSIGASTGERVRSSSKLKALLSVLVILMFVVLAGAKDLPENPMFLRWLQPDKPTDETIRVYWEKVSAGEATAEEMVDLGSMLYLRGYPKDAIRLYRRALDENDKVYEAWFRIGLVEHREGNLRAARRAYRKCLKELTGHGWCNFYMGLLEEQLGNPSRALDYYRRAFKFAPGLADPKVNPELLYSELQLGAVLRHNSRDRFTTNMPMDPLQPEKVAEVKARFEPPPPEDPVVAEEPAADRAPVVAPTPAPGLRPAPDPASVVDRQRRRSPFRIEPATPNTAGSDEPAPPAPPPRRNLDPRSEPSGLSQTPEPGTEKPEPGTPKPESEARIGGSTSAAGYAPRVGGASPEAFLLPFWPSRLERMALEISGPGVSPNAVPYFPPPRNEPG